LYSAGLVFLALTVTLIITLCNIEKGKKLPDGKPAPGVAATLFSKLTAQINLCVVLIVVSVPEGLPLTVGVSLAFSVKKMFADKILVRELDAPERMGAVEEICCGKTGTLTKGAMKVTQFQVEARPIKNSRANTLMNCELSPETLERIHDSILYNTEARVEMDATTYVPVGSGTEVALLRFLQDAGVPVHLLIQRKLGRIRGTSPFSPETKRSVVALQSPSHPDKVVVYVKGAPEVVLGLSTHIVGAGGAVSVLSAEERSEALETVAVMAARPLRVLGFAYAEMDVDTWNSQYENQGTATEKTLEDALASGQLGLTYLATFGLRDPLRDVVASAVSHARDEAHINVRLVSGDHLETAKAVAERAGILTPEEAALPYAFMHAEEFRATVGNLVMSQDEDGKQTATVEDEMAFREVAENLRVLARATAADKHLLVAGLKSMARVVAATGEGINDVSALRRADVGLAMGSGCSAAKEAASLVLTDDDFQASLRGIMWGRNIFHNVARFLQFQITVNISVVFTVFVGCCFFAESPISAVGLLWINLIMDTFAALALSTEPPLRSIIQGRPNEGGAKILADHVWRQILGISILNMVIMTILIFFGSLIADLQFTNEDALAWSDQGRPHCYNDKLPPHDIKQCRPALAYFASLDKRRLFTYIFNTFVFLQLFNEINCRKIGAREFNVFSAPFHNAYFLLVLGGTAAAQVCLVQLFPSLCSVTSLSRGEWGACLVIGATPLLGGLILKLTPDTWPQKITCGRLPNEDDAVDHAALKAWNATQAAAAKPAAAGAVGGPEPGDEMELSARNSDRDAEAGNDFQRMQ
jgi:Ca2+ transporting ATPase